MQKLHEQNAQEIANNQILKLANENKLLESRLALADTLREDTEIKLQQAEKERKAAIIDTNYLSMQCETQEDRADFNGKVAGWLVAANVALTVSVVMLLLP